MLGLDEPYHFADVFLVVNMDSDVSLDYADWPDGKVTPQHLAFLVNDDDEFDATYARIRANGLDHWADPLRDAYPARSTTTTAVKALTRTFWVIAWRSSTTSEFMR